jgi:transposase
MSSKNADGDKSSDEPYDDPKILRDMFVGEQMKHSEISERFSVSRSVISRRIDKFEIENPWRDEYVLRRLYIDNRLSQSEVANRLRCDRMTVKKWLDKLGIPSRKQSESQRVIPPSATEKLRRLYIDEERTAAEIGRIFDCDETVVLRELRRRNIPVRERGPPANTEMLRDSDALYELYRGQGLEIFEIAERLGCSQGRVGRWLRIHGFETPGSGPKSGPKHPHWKGGISSEYADYGSWYRHNRPKVIGRDDEQCRRCGLHRTWHREVYGRDIEVHHIEPFDPRKPIEPQHRMMNLITLCQKCHRKMHKSPTINQNEDEQT